jgi:4-amino-4-deoxy-L-arabinose transferase-like glycosyltransferase
MGADAAGAEGSGARAELAGVLAAAALSLAALGAHAALFEPARLHVADPFVDQLGYVTTARRLLDAGEFRPGVLFPAFLENPHYRPYMPGHYLALAASYALLGWGTLATLLPSLVGHLLVVVSAFWIGRRLHGRAAGLAGACAVAFFPPLLAYAFTAMAELTLSAACMLALAAFVSFPRRWRPWAAPALLALPFLFRETGAFCCLPMAALVLLPRERGAWRRVAGMGLAAALVLAALQAWQLATGKGVLPFGTRIAEGSFNYGDAFAAPAPEPSLGGWAAILAENTGRNLELFGATLRTALTEPSTLGFLAAAAAALAALLIGLRSRGRDPFALGAGLMGVVTLVLVFTVYDVKNERALRSMLYAFPPCAVALAGALVPPARARLAALAPRARAVAAGALLLGAAGLLLGGRALVARTAGELLRREAALEPFGRVLAELHGSDERLLVAPLGLAGAFLVERYPLLGASVPYNDATLELLLAKHAVGTLVLPEDWLGTNLSAAALQRHAFRRVAARGKFLFYRAGP